MGGRAVKYGQGFWAVCDGRRVEDRSSPDAYPRTVGFEYADGTGDRGELLLRDFTVDYVPPNWCGNRALRMTVRGNPWPLLRRNAFDFDWASIPAPLRGPLTCDKADHRLRPGALFHDAGFCVHEVLPFMTLAWWNEFLVEAVEAYCDTGRRPGESPVAHASRLAHDAYLRAAVGAGVTVGGPFYWKKTPEDVAFYRTLFHVEHVPA